MIDLHTHILPGVDDGAQTIEDSLAMAELAAKDGITVLAATPHVIRGLYDNCKEDILKDVENLNKNLAEKKINLLILPGAEYRLEADLPRRLADDDLLTINNAGGYLLIELPSTMIPENTDRILYEIQLQGVTPIIAHPERNMILARHPELLENYNEKGILAQVTSASITGLFGKTVKKTALKILQNGFAQIIASDGHAIEGRVPVLSEASRTIKYTLGTEYAQALAFENPQRIIMNQVLQTLKPPSKKAFWKRFNKTNI